MRECIWGGVFIHKIYAGRIVYMCNCLEPMEKKRYLNWTASMIIWIHFSHNICISSRVNCEHNANMFVLISLRGQSEDSDLGAFFRFLLCSLIKWLVSRTDLSWSNTLFPFCFSSLLCTTWYCWIKMSSAHVGSPHLHANLNTFVQCVRVHVCVYT